MLATVLDVHDNYVLLDATICQEVTTFQAELCVCKAQNAISKQVVATSTVLTPAQKQARINRLLNTFINTYMGLDDAKSMLQKYEHDNRARGWGITNQEFSDFAQAFGGKQSYLVQGRMLLLWRKDEFQKLIQQYVV